MAKNTHDWREMYRSRRGFASEAAARLLDYAFGELDLHRVYAITDQENVPSVALLERLGIRGEGSFVENAWFEERKMD